MDSDEKPRVVQTTKVRRRSRRRRVVERFALVLGLPTLLFVVVALSAGIVEYIPASTSSVEYETVEPHRYREPEMVDLGFDPEARRAVAMGKRSWPSARARR